MKGKAVPILLLLLSLPLVSSGWIGHGVKVSEKNGVVIAVSNETGIHVLISPMKPANTTWNCSFMVKGEGIEYLLVEPGYFSSNGSFLSAKSPTLIGNGSFGWKNASIVIPPVKGASLSAAIFVINGTGRVEIANITFERVVPKPEQAQSTPESSTSGTPQQSSTPTAINRDLTGNIQKLVINGTDMSVVIIINSTYHPGETIRADFFITNKVGTLNEIDIGLDVYYFGVKVFSYSHPSWREYPAGKTVHIYQESKLPAITPPGRYKLQFYITPVGRETLEVSGEITVLPNLEWFLLMGFLLVLFAGAVYVVLRRERYLGWLVKAYNEFSAGQKFIFFAVIGLILAALILAMGAENYANDVAIFVYYLLLVGILNLWIEYFEPRWDVEEIRMGVSILLLAGLVYLSRDVFTLYLSAALVIVAVIMLAPAFKERAKEWSRNEEETEEKTSPRIPEIEIIGETEDGFIIYRERSDENEG